MVLRGQIVVGACLPVGESEDVWRLIAEVDAIQNVLQVAFAESSKPGSPLGFAERSFQLQSCVRSACAELPLNLFPITFSSLHRQNAGRAIRITYRPRALIQGHIFGQITVKYCQRAIVRLTVCGMERRMKQYAVQVQTDAAERGAAH